MCLEDSGKLFAFRTLSCTRVLPEIQLRQVVQKNWMSTSTATSQRVQHNSAFATERWRPLLQIMITMFLLEKNQDIASYRRLCSSWQFLDYMMDLIILGFRPMCVLKLLSQSGSSNFLTVQRRPRSSFKIRRCTAHDNHLSLKHTPQTFTTAGIDHRMCETIRRIRLVCLNLEQYCLKTSSSSRSMTRFKRGLHAKSSRINWSPVTTCLWVECAVGNRWNPMWWYMCKHRFTLDSKGPAEVYTGAEVTQ